MCKPCQYHVCEDCIPTHNATVRHIKSAYDYNALLREKEKTQMPMQFNVSRDDLLRATVIKPGLYLLKVESVTQGPGKNDPQSITTTVNMKIVSGPDPKAVGVPITTWFSEKAAGLAVEFLEAITKSKIPEGGVNIDLEAAIGREVKGYVENEKYQGKLQNKIVGWVAA